MNEDGSLIVKSNEGEYLTREELGEWDRRYFDHWRAHNRVPEVTAAVQPLHDSGGDA